PSEGPALTGRRPGVPLRLRHPPADHVCAGIIDCPPVRHAIAGLEGGRPPVESPTDWHQERRPPAGADGWDNLMAERHLSEAAAHGSQHLMAERRPPEADRKSVVEGKSG